MPGIIAVLIYVFVTIPLANRLFSLEITPRDHDTLVAFLIGMSVGLLAALQQARRKRSMKTAAPQERQCP